MPRVLITGVAGHLGSKLAEWIRDHHPDCQITGVDNLSSGYRENVPAGVSFHQGDIGTDWARCLFGVAYDVVFHFAGFAAEVLSPHVRLHTIDNVWRNTASLINHLLNGPPCGRLVFASSVAVYGKAAPPFAETLECRPHDTYGVAKLAAERDIQIAGDQHDLDWCVLRLHNVYGPGQDIWNRHRNVFGLWMRAALDGQPALIYGDGGQRRGFTYIDDVLPAIWQAGVNPRASRKIINLGGSKPMTIGTACQIFSDVLQGEAPVFKHAPAP